ncbi:hypothetical protein M23134_04652 [Microscilla marina ATCC 23134]|uniref:Uncharacterized protein n=1 Tax=Microscilla marina ATCC 23134 TaxID=313606 RepID=A1ZTF2_MICM2|nr:hypothetical protein M23134_04652 [Microscilla marina ATCC 23134]
MNELLLLAAAYITIPGQSPLLESHYFNKVNFTLAGLF